MKKLLVSLGVIGMLAATPAFAATKHIMHTKNHAHVYSTNKNAKSCMLHGKRVACHHHSVHAAKKATKAKAY